MKTEIINPQTLPMLNQKKLSQLLQWLCRRVEEMDPGTPWEGVSLVLLDDEGITALNRDYFQKEKPTDVISFRYPPAPGAEEGCTGELYVNVERAAAVGDSYAGQERELALYTAHGCLHLTGADDATPEERDAMRVQEEAWLNDAAGEGLLAGLWGEGTRPTP